VVSDVAGLNRKLILDSLVGSHELELALFILYTVVVEPIVTELPTVLNSLPDVP
jgi:hypothetical protein